MNSSFEFRGLLKVFLIILAINSITLKLHSQTTPALNVTPIENPGEIPGIVRNLLNGGGFDTIYGINFTGNLNGIGTFTDGQDIGFPTGIIISNGSVINAEGFNVNGAQYLENDELLDTAFGAGNDPDLAQLCAVLAGSDKPVPVCDASVLTFYVRPFSDKITIWFVFASEEYEHYQHELGKPDFISEDSLKQDVAGIYFWANPADKKLVSRVQPGGPGVWYPVSLKYLNSSMNPTWPPLYIENPPNPLMSTYSTEFDGFTVPLMATNHDFEVLPCVTYGIKIAVADYYYQGSESGYPYSNHFNTALFLQAGSMIGGNGLEWSFDLQNDNNDFSPMEIVEGGCSRMIINLKKNQPTFDTLWVRFKIQNADSTEYTITPAPKQDSLLGIPWSDSVATYILEATDDFIPEGSNGTEKWFFRYQEDQCDVPSGGWGTGTQGYSGIDTIFVHDHQPFSNGSKSYGPIPSSIFHCGNTVAVTIDDILTGGVPPIFYQWTNPPQIGNQAVFNTVINGSPDYAYCTVTDRCSGKPGYVAGSDTVVIYSQLDVQASPDFQLCQNGQSQIKVQNTNVGRDFTTVWYFQGNPVGYDSLYLVTWAEYGSYAPNTLTFTCEVTDDCGNVTSDQVNATFFPVVEITGVPLICIGDDIQLICSGAQEYQWYRNSISPPNAIPGATNQTMIYHPTTPGFHTICVQILNDCGELADTCYTFEVSQLTCAVQLDNGTDFNVCPNVPFTLRELNAYDGWKWSWYDNGSNHTAIGQTISISLNDAGNHTVQVIAYNIHGCYDTLNFTVTVFPYAQLEATTQWPEVCVDYPTELNCHPNGPVTGVTYHWTAIPPDPTLKSPWSQNPTVAPLQTTTYQCRVLDNNGCYDSTTVTGTVRPRMIGSIIAMPGFACTDKPVQLNFMEVISPLPGASYYWVLDGATPPTSSLEMPTVLWTSPGQKNIQLIITEPGCEETFYLNYTVHPDPQALFTATNNAGCQPVEVSFFNNSQNIQTPTYLWEFGDGTTSTETNPTHLYEFPGNYDITLTVTNQTGCTNTLTINDMVEIYAVPVADFGAEPQAATIDNPTIRFTEMIDIPYALITWDFGDGASNSGDASPRHTYGAEGTYYVVMYTETEHGCWDRDTLEIGILSDIKIYVPNAFTPDGDGLNDCFSIGGTTGDIIDAFRIIIYSRWGEQILDIPITDPNCVWDGKDMTGMVVTPDSYVFRIFGKDFRGAKKVYEGVVTIVK
jgi:gliding motility-associated-like protein